MGGRVHYDASSRLSRIEQPASFRAKNLAVFHIRLEATDLAKNRLIQELRSAGEHTVVTETIANGVNHLTLAGCYRQSTAIVVGLTEWLFDEHVQAIG